MILYIAYWSERHPQNIVIESFEAQSSNTLQEKYSWNPEDVTPDIYPKYYGANFGKEERCQRNKNMHYVIHNSLEDLQERIHEIIDRHIYRYTEKLREWKNTEIIFPEEKQEISILK